MTTTATRHAVDDPTLQQPRPTARRARRLSVTAAIGVLLALLLAVANVAPAQAYQFPSPTGPTGWFQVGASYINSGPNGTFGPQRIAGPSVTVARSASVVANSLQKVAVTYSVQQWTTRGWVNVANPSFTAWISAGQSTVTITPQTLGAFSPGYYRVGGSVAWYDASSFTMTGYQFFYPTAASENVCTISNCAAYNGYVWFG